MAEGSRMVLVTPDDVTAVKAACAYSAGETGITVNGAGILANLAVYQEKQAAGWTVVQFATVGERTVTSAKGKVTAHGNVSRDWRHAKYLRAAATLTDTVGATIRETLQEAAGKTDKVRGKMLRAAQEALIEAGALTGKSKTGESHATRAAKAAMRAVKRFKVWENKGIPATAGATSDVPAHNVRDLVTAAWDGATVETLATMYRENKPDKPVAVETPDVVTGAASPVPATVANTGKGKKKKQATGN